MASSTPISYQHEDLSDYPTEKLQQLLAWNETTLASYQGRIEEFRQCPDPRIDILTLEGIESILEERIKAIKNLLETDDT
ncbi:ATP-dependent DNA helicase sgs1 [Marasmius crinis-equi]|uniref:ATP-dependent DNA helicase sgs1 n=1 Tax=Marasmius crinis-equi TaxID=585013 RepID=A0ABR3FAS7_9AGAR